MNKIFLVGNLTRDAELKTAQNGSGSGYALFSLAVRRGVDKNGEQITDFFDCIAGGKLGEAIAKYAKKGHKIAVCGQMAVRNVQEDNGKTRRYYSVIVSDCEFCQPKRAGAEATAKQDIKKPVEEPLSDSDYLPF